MMNKNRTLITSIPSLDPMRLGLQSFKFQVLHSEVLGRSLNFLNCLATDLPWSKDFGGWYLISVTTQLALAALGSPTRLEWNWPCWARRPAASTTLVGPQARPLLQARPQKAFFNSRNQREKNPCWTLKNQNPGCPGSIGKVAANSFSACDSLSWPSLVLIGSCSWYHPVWPWQSTPPASPYIDHHISQQYTSDCPVFIWLLEKRLA